jgi:voltage-gated potassium channel Kch
VADRVPGSGFRTEPDLRDHVVMPVLRPWKKFRADPSSIKWATAASVSVTLSLVLVGAAVMRIFDSDEYPTYGEALWFTLQTITTVGYGDVTPTSGPGRFFATVVMLISIGLITVITAAITSLFVESARARRRAEEGDRTDEALARIEASIAAAQERLDRIEHAVASPPTSPDGT